MKFTSLIHGVLMLILATARPLSLEEIQGIWIGVGGNFFMKVTGHSILYYGAPNPPRLTIDGQIVPRYAPPANAYPPAFADTLWITQNGALAVLPESGQVDTIGYLSIIGGSLTIRDTRGSPPLFLNRIERDTTIHLKKIQLSLGDYFDLQLTSRDMILYDHSKEHLPYARTASRDGLFARCEQTIQEADFLAPKAQVDSFQYFENAICLGVSYNDTTRFLFFHPGGTPAELSPMVPLLLGLLDSTSFVPFDTVFVFQSRLRHCSSFEDSIGYMESLYPSLYHVPHYRDDHDTLEAYLHSRLSQRLSVRGYYSFDVLLDESGVIVDIRDFKMITKTHRQVHGPERQDALILFQQALGDAPRFTPAIWEGRPVKVALYGWLDFDD